MRICAILLLVSIIFLPMYNGWLGTVLPSDDSISFIEVMESILEGNLDNYMPQLTLVTIIIAVLLTIFAFGKIRILSIISSGLGIITMITLLVMLINDTDVDHVLNFSDTYICIGYWTTLLLYVICFYLSFDKPDSPKADYSSTYADKLSQIPPSAPNGGWVCNVCGETNSTLSSGCKKCGNRK